MPHLRLARTSGSLLELIRVRIRPFSAVGPIRGISSTTNRLVTKAALTFEQSNHIHDRLCERADLDGNIGCSTGEVQHPTLRNHAIRPCPSFAPYDEWQHLFDVYSDYAPHLFKFIRLHLRAGVQTYDRSSKLGAPFFENVENKLDVIRPYWTQLLKGDLSLFEQENIFVITNVRLQPESRKKIREMPYIMDNEYLELKVDEKFRYMKDVDRVGSRNRMVYNFPGPINLLMQVVDSMIHNVYMNSIFAHHNMTALVGKRLPGKALFLDVSHFERSAGAILPLRAKYIGGLYGQMLVRMLNLRFLSLGLDGYTYFIKTDGDVTLKHNEIHVPDIFVQLGSGLSVVAPVAKELLHILYSSFFVEEFGYTKDEAISIVYEGGNNELRMMNYGDDNVIFGNDVSLIHRCYDWIAKFLPVSIEVPPAFLGYTYPPFQLRTSSYVLNEWEPERPPFSRFRPYPFYGMVERDKVYREQTITKTVRELEVLKYKLLSDFGYTRELINMEAYRESERIKSEDTLASNTNVLLGKEYLLTAEDKLKSLRYVGLGEMRVAEIMRALLAGSSLEKHSY